LHSSVSCSHNAMCSFLDIAHREFTKLSSFMSNIYLMRSKMGVIKSKMGTIGSKIGRKFKQKRKKHNGKKKRKFGQGLLQGHYSGGNENRPW